MAVPMHWHTHTHHVKKLWIEKPKKDNSSGKIQHITQNAKSAEGLLLMTLSMKLKLVKEKIANKVCLPYSAVAGRSPLLGHFTKDGEETKNNNTEQSDVNMYTLCLIPAVNSLPALFCCCRMSYLLGCFTNDREQTIKQNKKKPH